MTRTVILPYKDTYVAQFVACSLQQSRLKKKKKQTQKFCHHLLSHPHWSVLASFRAPFMLVQEKIMSSVKLSP